MRRVTVIVSKDQLTHFLSYVGQEGPLHLVTEPEKQIPAGASPLETASIVARSAAIRNRLATIAPLMPGARGVTAPGGAAGQSTEGLADYLDKHASSMEQVAN